MKNSSSKIFTGLAITLSSLLVACSAFKSTYSINADQAQLALNATPESIRAEAKEVGDRAMAWQLARMDNFEDYIVKMGRTPNTKEWVQAAFYIGLTQWVEATNDQAGLTALKELAIHNDYQLAERPFHADDQAVGQIYLWLAEQGGDKSMYEPTQKVLDLVLAESPATSLSHADKGSPDYVGSCKKRWCWSDALFMAPRTWLMLGNATGDSRYIDYANKEFWATTDYLFSKEHSLYYRDSRYFKEKGDNGAPVFWSRGNGWVFSALPMFIDDMAEDHPERPRYIELFKILAKGLVNVQKPDGYWATSLMDPNSLKTPEISGTGFMTYGLVWGINNGFLTDQESIDAAKKGWAALTASVDDEGMVHWVQQIGKSPDPAASHHTQVYGTGAVLLAASEMLKWEK
tara:strand:- start:26001 stop:27209 length:1209 start_codon:yes stop_codon:yes gene_type:complete